jgi:hypothetical protein
MGKAQKRIKNFQTIAAPAGTNPSATGPNQTLTITSDGLIVVTGNSGTNTLDYSLVNSGVGAGSYGSASSVATFTVSAKGLLSAAATVSIAIAASQVTSGTFADARISQSSVTQYNSVLDHGLLAGIGDDDHTMYIRHDGTRAFSGNQSMGGFKLTSLGAPTVSTDAATKNYVDSALNGLDWKPSVRAASTGNLNLSSMPSSVDSVSLSSGERFLAKDQTAPAENGIYIFNGAGSAATRAEDADSWLEIVNASCFVEEGTTNSDRAYTCTSNTGGTLGSTAITWVQFSSASSYIGGDGVNITGNQIDVDHDGQGLIFSAGQLALELDGSTLSKGASGLKLSDTAVTPNPYGSSSQVGSFTVDQQGRITAASNISIDHSAIINLSWTASGHTGTASNLAGWNGANAPIVYGLSGTGTTIPTTVSPVFTTPNLGTPSALVGTNITGTASGLTAGTVTTNANLTGHITSVGNAAVLGSFTSAQLLSALTDPNGIGQAVFTQNPSLYFPMAEALELSGSLIRGIPFDANGHRFRSVSTFQTMHDDSGTGGTVAQASVDTFDSLTLTADTAVTITNLIGCIFRLPVAGTGVTVTNPVYSTGIESLVVGTAAMANLEFTLAGTSTKAGIYTSQNANNSPGGLTFLRSSATLSHSPELIFGKSKGTTAARTVTATNDVLGKISFVGHDGTDFAYGARIIATVTETTPGSGAMGSKLDFLTTPAGSETPAVNLSIASTGVSTFSGTVVHRAGTTTAGTAPAKYVSGSLLTTAEVGALEFLTDKFYYTITTGAARKEITLNDAALTSGRVPFTTTNGRLTDDSSFTFSTSTGLTLTDKNIVLSASTGTRIGTATTQKLAFYNSSPIAQPSSTGETTGFTAGGGTGVTDASTFTGNVGATAYRLSEIVKHLKNLGLIAA